MAKGKTLNPADAHRKAERKKELKKNKSERQKARDFALVKKDTTSIEEDIERLTKADADGVISAAEKSRLASLRSELDVINKKKDEWVEEHPEHKSLVYRGRFKKAKDEADENDGPKRKDRKVFDKNGLPRHPERSIYYDPVMNPYGVAPPGMPYMERPLRPDEVDSQEEDSDEEDSDDDIPMPTAPPPGSRQENEDDAEESDDDIPLPEGPPPSKAPSLPPLPPGPPPPLASTPIFSLPMAAPPFPSFPPLHPPSFLNTYPGLPMGFPPLPPPPGFSVPPPPGFSSLPNRPPPSLRIQSHGAIQDPLASGPHQTYQAHQIQHLNHPLPAKPNPSPTTATPVSVPSSDSGTISAPAQLRDLKKESTAFVPTSLKRKKAGGGGTSVSKRIDAAPDSASPTEAGPTRPDLLGALASNFPGAAAKKTEPSEEPAAKKKKVEPPAANKGGDDYEKFMKEIGDIL